MTSVSFPVYDQLLATSISKPVDWSKACVTINSLSNEHTNFITALIFHHYQLEAKSNAKNVTLEQILSQYQNDTRSKPVLNLPYGAQTFKGGKGVVITAGNLPGDLQKVISNYLDKITV